MLKFLLAITLAIVAIFVFDGLSILNTRRNVGDVSKATAIAALQTLSATQDPAKARAAADAEAKRHHDVITGYRYNPVGQELTVTVSGSAWTIIFSHLNRSISDDINATAGTRRR